MTVYVVFVFALTYLLIAKRHLRLIPLGRAAGALLGATLMVLGGALTSEQAFAAVDPKTIALLLGMMMITAFLAEGKALELAAAALVTRLKTPRGMLAATSIASGVLSAALVNDTVCLFATPIVALACRKAGLPPFPYLMAVATSSNVGSIGTLVGNPQLMLIGAQSGIGFADYFVRMAPIAGVLLLVNTALLVVFYGPGLPRSYAPPVLEPVPRDRFRLGTSLAVLGAVFVAFFAGVAMEWAALAGGVALIWIWRRDPAAVFGAVDWRLLVFFGGLFIVTKGLDRTGLSAALMERLHGTPWYVPWIVVGSNLFSNVPLVLLAGPHVAAAAATPAAAEHGWLVLALVSTTAGNFTLVGSAANLIVAEQAELGFWAYFKFGAVSTIVTTALGLWMLG
jgi:Na+/H+ antiporter NhaD/arsenite permease-like protein